MSIGRNDKIILLLLGAGLLRLSWHKWANIIMDYGREVYIPWRITCGDVLYKDIASLFGPFPPYFNAFLFKVFGASVTTLAFFNILLVACITLLIYRFFNDTAGKRVALFTSAAFLCLFAFEQTNLDQGIFAYICPSSYSMTYAVFFALWAIDVFAAYSRSGKDILLGAVGVLIGLTALCRFEIFVFLAVAVGFGFILKGILGSWTFKRRLKAKAFLLGGFCVPVGIAFLYFSKQLPLAQVIPDILGFNDQWSEILKGHYYQFMTGLDYPWLNFKLMMATAACYCLMFAAVKFLSMGTDRFKKNGEQWQGAVFVLLGLAGIEQAALWILRSPYNEIFKGLPVMVIFMAGYLLWLLWRHRRDEEKTGRILPLWVMAVWALLMLTKIFLKVKLNSVGFVYAMPAFMVFIVLFQGLVPRQDHFAQTLTSVLVILLFITGLRHTLPVYQMRNYIIRSGVDTMLCNGRSGPEIAEIAAFLKNADEITPKGAEFAAFPQGAMLNFLTKRKSPLPHVTFLSAEVARYGEGEMLRSFAEHRPEYVILANEGIFPYYNPRFRETYNRPIKEWIFVNYHPVWPARPAISDMIRVFKRNSSL